MAESNDEVIYLPCKKCGSRDYDNADFDVAKEDSQGRIVIEPDECDRCNFNLVLSPSEYLH